MVDWCRSKVSHLIEKLRQHPILWDVRCTDEKDKHSKVEALEEISHELHVPVEEVVKKLHSLKVQFSREHCRVRKEKQRGGRIYIPKWYGYEQLLFLKDANTRHKKFTREQNEEYNECTNSDDISIASLNSIKEEYTGHEDHEDCSALLIRQTETSRPLTDQSSLGIGNSFNHLQTQVQGQKLVEQQNGNYDEFISFGLYIANKLRALDDPYLQAIAKHNMNKAIFNVELKKCQRLATSKASSSRESDFHNNLDLNAT